MSYKRRSLTFDFMRVQLIEGTELYNGSGKLDIEFSNRNTASLIEQSQQRSILTLGTCPYQVCSE